MAGGEPVSSRRIMPHRRWECNFSKCVQDMLQKRLQMRSHLPGMKLYGDADFDHWSRTF